MRILLTGAAGFLGSHLADRFLADGHEVIGMDNLITGNLDNISHLENEPRFDFVEHDVTQFIDITGNLDGVLHFASPASPASPRAPCSCLRPRPKCTGTLWFTRSPRATGAT